MAGMPHILLPSHPGLSPATCPLTCSSWSGWLMHNSLLAQWPGRNSGRWWRNGKRQKKENMPALPCCWGMCQARACQRLVPLPFCPCHHLSPHHLIIIIIYLS